VNETTHVTERVGGDMQSFRDRGFVCDVNADADATAAEVRRHLDGTIAHDVPDRDRTPLRGKQLGTCPANSGCATGDDDPIHASAPPKM
jgi:hypothetical protein